MNILIDDDLNTHLFSKVKYTLPFGSKIKGNANSESDDDLILIIPEYKSLIASPFFTRHCLQFKTENRDLIYSTESQFINNLVNGETVINHQILTLGYLKNTPLEFLEKIDMNQFKLIRAYLGLMKRDLKDASSNIKNDKIFNKKIKFYNEGVQYLNSIGIEYFPFEVEELDKNIEYVKMHSIFLEDTRKSVIRKLEKGTIKSFISYEDTKVVADFLSKLDFLENDTYTNKILNLYYEASICNNYSH